MLTLLSSRSLFLAVATSSCSAASCFSFSSSWRFRTATGSPFCVACQGGVAHQWGPPPPNPSLPPHTHGILPSVPGENSAPVSKTEPWGQPIQKWGAFPPLRTSQGTAEWQSLGGGQPWWCRQPYRVPGVLDDARFLREDLNELLGLPLAEHHAADGGHKRLVGQVEGPVRVRRC